MRAVKTSDKKFSDKVFEFVVSVPPGTVVTYSEVAIAVGHPNAARAVGQVLKSNNDASIPCHRVVRADGGVGGYNGLRGDKRSLLQSEGVSLRADS